MQDTQNKACFFDRDGCLIVEQNYLSDPDRVHLETNAAAAVRLMREHGYRIIVISNQSGIARGYFTMEQLKAVEARVNSLIEAEGGKIDAFYYCPHHVKGIIPEYTMECDCRKPKSGMFLHAAKDWNLDLSRCFMIGDRISDLEAGLNAGCANAALVRTGYGMEQDLALYPNAVEAPDLLTACRKLLDGAESQK